MVDKFWENEMNRRNVGELSPQKPYFSSTFNVSLLKCLSNGHDFNAAFFMSLITVIIETPRNNPGKYVYDNTDRCYKLKKVLPLGMHFPYDFGSIEGTLADDGDPADAMVFTECLTYPGVRFSCRIIGALQAKQNKEGTTIRNDRYFVVPEDSIVFEHIKEIRDFSKRHNRQLQDFFANYIKAENKRLMNLKFINSSNAVKNLRKLIS